MKRILIFSVVTILAISVVGFSFADTETSPLELLEDLTATEITKSSDETYGDLAKEYGVYDEFHAAFLVHKLELLQEKVSSGELSQERYDELVVMLNDCDGNSKLLANLGMRFSRVSASMENHNTDATTTHSRHGDTNSNSHRRGRNKH